MADQDALARLIDRGIAEGLDDAELRLLVQEFTTPPSAATAGMPEPSRPTDQPAQPFAGLGIRTVSEDDWARMNTGEKARGLLQAGGKGLLGAFVGPGGAKQMVEHPGATLATFAAGPAIGAAGKYGPPAVRAGVQKVADVLDKPVVGAAIGAEESGRHTGWDWKSMLLGGAAGAAWSSKVAGALRKMSGGTASSRMVEGMSQGPAVNPAAARGKDLERLLKAGSYDDLASFLGPSAKPPAGAVAPVARAAASQSDDLARELLARDIDWRSVDAVPIDAITRDISRKGGSILEAGESRVGLAERMANALKAGQAQEAERLARALRQRMHITANTTGARR